jgi:hypothetical protein
VKLIENCFLYGIVDIGYVPEQNVGIVTKQLVAGGIDILQLRAKGYLKYPDCERGAGDVADYEIRRCSSGC